MTKQRGFGPCFESRCIFLILHTPEWSGLYLIQTLQTFSACQGKCRQDHITLEVLINNPEATDNLLIFRGHEVYSIAYVACNSDCFKKKSTQRRQRNRMRTFNSLIISCCIHSVIILIFMLPEAIGETFKTFIYNFSVVVWNMSF